MFDVVWKEKEEHQQQSHCFNNTALTIERWHCRRLWKVCTMCCAHAWLYTDLVVLLCWLSWGHGGEGLQMFSSSLLFSFRHRGAFLLAGRTNLLVQTLDCLTLDKWKTTNKQSSMSRNMSECYGGKISKFLTSYFAHNAHDDVKTIQTYVFRDLAVLVCRGGWAQGWEEMFSSSLIFSPSQLLSVTHCMAFLLAGRAALRLLALGLEFRRCKLQMKT